MSKLSREVASLIESYGGELIRHSKHPVYRFPNGVTMPVSLSPRCDEIQQYNHVRQQLERLHGVSKGSQHRRERRKGKPGAPPRPTELAPSEAQGGQTLKDALRKAMGA